MLTGAERKTVNNFLGNRGFSTLDSPGDMVRQLAYCVEDDDHFRRLLTKCPPEDRYGMYESMKPYLNFIPKALDVYIAESGSIAEAKQLPTVDESGAFHPHMAPVLESEQFIVQQALEKVLLQCHLRVTCAKCSKYEVFHGARKADAIQAARNEGWSYDELEGKGREICPNCPGGRKQ